MSVGGLSISIGTWDVQPENNTITAVKDNKNKIHIRGIF